MIRPRVTRAQARVSPVLARSAAQCDRGAARRRRPRSRQPRADSVPGQFFPITEPITQDTLTQIRAATRQLVDRNAAAEQGEAADSGFRVPARRFGAGVERIRCFLRPG